MCARIASSSCLALWLVVAAWVPAALAETGAIEYRVLATSKTSTMEQELNAAAEDGFRFQQAMGGSTAAGGSEVVAIMAKAAGSPARYAYRLLATTKTSTMEKELQAAANQGFEYRAQTIFKSTFGGEEVVCILERDKDSAAPPSEYKLVATSKTSTLQKELAGVGAQGYEVVGTTVAKTFAGGSEIVAILRRAKKP